LTDFSKLVDHAFSYMQVDHDSIELFFYSLLIIGDIFKEKLERSLLLNYFFT